MISYNQVLLEMERQLAAAKNTEDEREMREALAAIRSLCEVALGGKPRNDEKVIPKMLSSHSVQPLTPIQSLEAKPMEEEGANGGSIFDF
ncbi:YwdI family protein [Sporosarcina jiandibaonis]|uniref:YwdI family protein n=1 Tax=Sporosarcina jiandibaonis TaxID=2715535 RepID=UPI00155454C7|nr:YwdI family protein [Sporosarcina jiandibaonis]